jgi:hypothetical protein
MFYHVTTWQTHVEAGKNTSTINHESRKMQQKGNPVVSDETVMYG